MVGLAGRGKSGLRRARMPANGWWRQLQGQCNRNIPPIYELTFPGTAHAIGKGGKVV